MENCAEPNYFRNLKMALAQRAAEQTIIYKILKF